MRAMRYGWMALTACAWVASGCSSLDQKGFVYCDDTGCHQCSGDMCVDVDGGPDAWGAAGSVCHRASDCNVGLLCDSHSKCVPGAGFQCTKDSDCVTGLHCTLAQSQNQSQPSGTCQAPKDLPCAKDADCLDGNVCSHGACKLPPGKNCGGSSDCASSLYCDSTYKICIAVAGAGCDTPVKCSLFGQVCSTSTGKCGQAPNGAFCTASEDCKSGYCVGPQNARHCLGTVGDACTTNGDCASSLCSNGSCTRVGPGSPCNVHADCPLGLACLSVMGDMGMAETTTCQKPPGGGCDTDGTCPNGLVCASVNGDGQSNPGGNRCYGGPLAYCESNADCVDSLQCFGGVCLPRAGSSCSTNCGSQLLTCSSGSCLGDFGAYCKNDAQCNANLICDPTLGRCIGGYNSDCSSNLTCRSEGAWCLESEIHACADSLVCVSQVEGSGSICDVKAGDDCSSNPCGSPALLRCDSATSQCMGRYGAYCNGVGQCDTTLQCDTTSHHCVPIAGTQTCNPAAGGVDMGMVDADAGLSDGGVDAGMACGEGLVCNSGGHCVADVGGYCDSTSQCQSGLSCVAHVCSVGQGGPLDVSRMCRFDAQCKTGGTCVNGLCAYGCTTSNDCGTGEECAARYGISSKYCYPITAPTGSACHQNLECGNGSCINGVCHASCDGSHPCSNSKDVCDHSVCQPDWYRQFGCQTGDDCAPGQACYDGDCRSPCASDANCSGSDKCGPGGYCVPGDQLSPQCSPLAPCAMNKACINAQCM